MKLDALDHLVLKLEYEASRLAIEPAAHAMLAPARGGAP